GSPPWAGDIATDGNNGGVITVRGYELFPARLAKTLTLRAYSISACHMGNIRHRRHKGVVNCFSRELSMHVRRAYSPARRCVGPWRRSSVVLIASLATAAAGGQLAISPAQAGA